MTLIGKGRTGEVYELGDKIIKLYFDVIPLEDVITEAMSSAIACGMGVPSPKVYRLIEFQGRKGLEFERINAKTIIDLFTIKPWNIDYYACLMAHLHCKVHSCLTGFLLPQLDYFENRISKSSHKLGVKATKILEYLKTLPSGFNICHGDFHPGNILISSKGGSVIDWATAYYGNPAGDIARTFLMIDSPSFINESSFLKYSLWSLFKRKFLFKYLMEYTTITGMSFDKVEPWFLPVAAARLSENIHGEENWLNKIIESKIKLMTQK